MHFVSTHLNKDHFFKKPHRWVIAVLASPIHAAELHYKKRYHLKFAHARKLFIMDMSMLLSVLLLSLASLFWYTYDPTITDLVSLSLATDSERVVSGEELTYTTTVTNYADVTLTEATIVLRTPPGFIIEKRTPESAYNAQTDTFTIPNLAPGAMTEISFHGTFFAVPEEPTPLEAVLSYIQEGGETRERIARTSFASLRGSLLTLSGTLPERIPAKASFPVTLTLANDGEKPLADIRIPLTSNGVTLSANVQPNVTISETHLEIDSIAAHTNLNLSVQATIEAARPPSHAITITPEILVAGRYIQQLGITHTFAIVTPALFAEASWNDAGGPLLPGQTVSANVQIRNSGDTALINVRVQPVTQKNIASTPAPLSSAQYPTLARIEAGASVTIPVYFTVNAFPSGNDLLFTPSVQVFGNMPNLPEVSTSFTATLPERPIGTRMRMSADVRYFTAEGDQLGRGPLPPRVGEQTKYWAIFTLTNGTSAVRDVQFSAQLAPLAEWTGRTAVSIGNDLSYTSTNRSISWQYGSLAPGAQVQLGMEIGFTPTASHLGSSPILMTAIGASGVDTYINAGVTAPYGAIDASLRNDRIAKEIGVSVK